MSVDFPSSTEPQVLKAEKVDGVMKGEGHVVRDLKISGFLAVFHGGFGGLVVGAGAALGHAGGGDLRDDVVHGVGRRFDASGADDVADGADADDEVLDLLRRAWAARDR